MENQGNVSRPSQLAKLQVGTMRQSEEAEEEELKRNLHFRFFFLLSSLYSESDGMRCRVVHKFRNIQCNT